MAEASIDDLCNLIMELHVRRKYCIKLHNKQTNAAWALAGRYLGIRKDMPEAERERINKQATRVVYNFLNEKPGHLDDLSVLSKMADLDVTAASLVPLENRRHEIELKMMRHSRKLPVSKWAKNVRGLGELGLAVVIGEAGNLSRFPHPRMLWKRLGLAPYSGKAMSNWHGAQLTDEEWTAAGYNKKRRAEIHACVGEPLFRAQTQSATNPADGPYRIAYDVRRAQCEAVHTDWTKGHLHGDALRIMTKALLSDLWSEWRGSMGSLKAMISVAPADSSVPAQAGGDVQSADVSQAQVGVPNPSEGEWVQLADDSQKKLGPSPSDPKRGGVQSTHESQMDFGPAAFANES